MNLEQTGDVTTKGEDQGIIKKMLIAVDESEYREKSSDMAWHYRNRWGQM
jgi:hypothetical protein